MSEEKIDDKQQCGKSELLLFDEPPVQIQIQEGKWDVISTKSNLESNTVIRFDIPGSSNYFISVGDTELHLDLFISKTTDKTSYIRAGETKVGPINNIIHSLFEQVTVNLNNTLVENSNSCYAYRAYMETLLNSSKEYKETILRAGNVWYKDEKDMDSSVFAPVTGGAQVNPCFVSRQKIFADGKTVQLCGKLHCDFFSQPRLLLPNVDIGVELTRSKPSFYLIGENAEEYQAHITKARLKVRRVTVSPTATFDI